VLGERRDLASVIADEILGRRAAEQVAHEFLRDRRMLPAEQSRGGGDQQFRGAFLVGPGKILHPGS
jgi:hypothetical protein